MENVHVVSSPDDGLVDATNTSAAPVLRLHPLISLSSLPIHQVRPDVAGGRSIQRFLCTVKPFRVTSFQRALCPDNL